MDALLRKLNHRLAATVTVLGAPPEMQPALERWSAETMVRRELSDREQFVLAFVDSRADIARCAAEVVAALDGDATLWMAYPKKSSRRYRSDVGRDDSWQPLGDLGFEPVRQVALDADWSALRFRRTEHIRTLTRQPSMALSDEGRRRTIRPPAAETPGTPQPVAAFLAALPEDRRPILQAVHDVIRAAAPTLQPTMWNTMIGYGSYHYRYASGREGDWFVVGLANQKRYVSLYLCATVDGSYLAEANAQRLGKVSVGKSCIRFRRLADLDLDVVAELVRTAADVGGAAEFAP